MFHEIAFFLALVAGWLVVSAASTREAKLAVAVYAVCVAGLLGVSALYHRVTWSPPARRRMRALDHAMIYLLIAGAYTPVGVLALHGALQVVVLAVVWTAAAAGIALTLAWTAAPKWASATIYVAIGSVAVVAIPQLWSALGAVDFCLILAGGLLYIAGAGVYASQRPDPWPAVFGYHEIFHLLVVAAIVLQYVAIARLAVHA